MLEPMKYPEARSCRWAFMKTEDIPSKVNPGACYLRRLRVWNTPWCSLYVHQIFERDMDRDPHDHPWTFWSLVLRGDYTEMVWPFVAHRGEGNRPHQEQRNHRRWSLHRMPQTHAHKISSVGLATVTLILTGPRKRQWGFWPSKGFVPWNEYLEETDVPG